MNDLFRDPCFEGMEVLKITWLADMESACPTDVVETR